MITHVVAKDMVDDVDALFGFGPSIVFRQGGVSADDGDDALGAGSDGGSVFEDEVEDGPEVAGAFCVESRGARMTVNGGPVEAVEFVGDVSRTVPIDEEFFDGFAMRMAADLAFAGVMVELQGIAAGVWNGVYRQRNRCGCGAVV